MILQKMNRNYTEDAVDRKQSVGDQSPPPGSKFFEFHAVSGKIWQNRMLAPPPGQLAPLPRGNPGSATDSVNHELVSNIENFNFELRSD